MSSLIVYGFSVIAMVPWAFVSPSSRGIGLAVTRRILRTTKCPVVATARGNTDQAREETLRGLDVEHDRLTVLKLDVTGKPPSKRTYAGCLTPAHNSSRRGVHLGGGKGLRIQIRCEEQSSPARVHPPGPALPREVSEASQRR